MRSEPYYMTIYHDIVRQIYTGQITVGDSLGSIRIMCERYAASANTVVTVVRKLSDNGFVSTRQGKVPVVVSDCGNQRQALERLCGHYWEITDTYDIFAMLYPSMAAYGAGKLTRGDCAALDAAVKRMEEHVNDTFVFRQQRSTFLRRFVAASGNSIMQGFCRGAEETLFIPRMASDVEEETERTLAPARVRFVRSARRVCSCAAAGEIEPLREELRGVYADLREKIPQMIAGIAAGRGYPLPDPASYVPKKLYLYDSIVSDLIDRIYAGDYREGDYLPSIESLCRQHGVSMPTVRSALRTLADLGLAQTVNGRGTRLTLFSDLPAHFSRSLEGMLRLSQMREAFELVAVTIGDVAARAAKNMTYEQAEATGERLRALHRGAPLRRMYPGFVLLVKIVEAAGSRSLDALYTELKMPLSLWIYLDRVYPEEMERIRECRYILCLEALEELKGGRDARFCSLISSIYGEVFEQVRHLLSKLGLK